MWVYDVEGNHYAEAHLEADIALTLRQAHALVSELEERARAEIPRLRELTTHIEPRGQLVQAASSGLEESQIVEAAERLVGEVGGGGVVSPGAGLSQR